MKIRSFIGPNLKLNSSICNFIHNLIVLLKHITSTALWCHCGIGLANHEWDGQKSVPTFSSQNLHLFWMLNQGRAITSRQKSAKKILLHWVSLHLATTCEIKVSSDHHLCNKGLGMEICTITNNPPTIVMPLLYAEMVGAVVSTGVSGREPHSVHEPSYTATLTLPSLWRAWCSNKGQNCWRVAQQPTNQRYYR